MHAVVQRGWVGITSSAPLPDWIRGPHPYADCSLGASQPNIAGPISGQPSTTSLSEPVELGAPTGIPGGRL